MAAEDPDAERSEGAGVATPHDPPAPADQVRQDEGEPVGAQARRLPRAEALPGSVDLPDFRVRGLAAVVAATVRLEAARRDLSQQDLGAMIGRSRASVSARWHDQVPWTVYEVGILAEYMGIHPGELLEGRPPRPRWGW
ncbi:helix-turn-helix domain-containing protein [Georgenia yuyongxinii]